MSITDDPMPGVAQPGTESAMVVGRKGHDIRVISIWEEYYLAHAEADARRIADQYDEVLVFKTTLSYRIWNREKNKTAQQAALDGTAPSLMRNA